MGVLLKDAVSLYDFLASDVDKNKYKYGALVE
jgi:hypothetical protein